MSCRNGGKAPTWLDKVTFIKHYAVDTCSTTLKVYLEMGAAADLNLFLNLSSISNVEAVYTLLRPKTFRTDRHGPGETKRGKPRSRFGKLGKVLFEGEEAIPDTANLIAKNVQVITGWERPVYGSLGTYLFEIAGPLIQQAYYLTLINAVNQFAYDWYSGILLAPQSKCDHKRYLLTVSRELANGDAYQTIPIVGQAFPPSGCHWSSLGLDLGPGPWTVILKVQIYAIPGFSAPGTAFFRMMLGDTPGSQCGPAHAVEVTASLPTDVKTFVWTVNGPDRVNIQGVFTTGLAPLKAVLVLADLEGFGI